MLDVSRENISRCNGETYRRPESNIALDFQAMKTRKLSRFHIRIAGCRKGGIRLSEY